MPRIDLVSSFRGLNQRFDQLIFDEVRRLSLPRTTPVTWFMEHMKHIERAIETITLDPKLVPRAFSCTHSYPNLRTVILKNGPDFTLKLKVDDCSALGAIISCMDLLRAYSSWTDENGYIAPLFETDTVPNSTTFQVCQVNLLDISSLSSMFLDGYLFKYTSMSGYSAVICDCTGSRRSYLSVWSNAQLN